MKEFIVYLTAGYPSLEDSFRIMEGIADLVSGIEIGIPFTDPIADGPVIQRASTYALSQGLRLKDVFEHTRWLSKKVSIPLYYMTYYNLLYRRGVNRFAEDSKKAGISGLIIPDVPLEESGELLSATRKAGIHSIMFITPTTPDERAIRIARRGSGFLYYVSVTGVTGERKEVNRFALRHIGHLKGNLGVNLPIMLGFGISSPDHVRSATKVADGVIVGSALIKEIDLSLPVKENVERVRRKIEWMREGLS